MVGVLTKKREIFQILSFAFQKKKIPTILIEAGKNLPKEKFDILFADEEYLPLIKKEYPETPIFLFTEKALPEDILREIQGYILIPFTLEFVIGFVDELYRRFWAKDEERRKDIRYHYELPVVFRFPQGEEREGWILDISKGGFRAVLKKNHQALKEEGEVEIQDSELNVSCSFDIRWKREEEGKIVFGASWKDLGEKEARAILTFLALHSGLFDL